MVCACCSECGPSGCESDLDCGCPDPTTDVYYPEIDACCQEGAVTFPKPGAGVCWEGTPDSESAYIPLLNCCECACVQGDCPP